MNASVLALPQGAAVMSINVLKSHFQQAVQKYPDTRRAKP
jgi:hypothetical protein